MRSIPAVAALVMGLAAPASAGLTEAPRLAAVYDTILGGRFDHARQQLADACPPAPVEACLALSVVSTWWEIQLDPTNRVHDEQLQRSANRAISAAQAWTNREPRRAEAWFYLAGSYAPLVQWHVLRGERLSAAREGNRIRASLERAVTLDPELQDAYLGIGLYHYYADIVPLGLKLLRALMLLPGGDRAAGLREILQARERGELLRGEVDYQLHWLYLWYEHEPQKALDLLHALDQRYPSNPLFLQGIAEIHRDYLHDQASSVAAWRELLARSLAGSVEAAPLIETRARAAIAAFK